ncbi:MAG: hypothetical protein GXO75_06135 [Calditrichaeota bacterium]|nr:hypothetical protein [Calditrichota bacterium]
MKTLWILILFAGSIILTCQKSPENENGQSYSLPKIQFQKAKPVWPKGKELEKNITIAFRGRFEKSQTEKTILRITGATLYRIYLNGAFMGHGPARAARGFFRVDEWDLTPKLKKGTNIVVIEVAGYNVNSYYLLDQPSFLQAEVISADKVLLATGSAANNFEAARIAERIQKVPRYSFQRPFIECYTLGTDSYKWRCDLSVPMKTLTCEIVSPRKLIPRRVTFPDFHVRSPIKIYSKGKIKTGVKPKKYWKDRSLTKIGPKLRGFKENELQLNPSITMQETVTASAVHIDKKYEKPKAISLTENSYTIVDFGVNLTGFVGATITCRKPTRLFFVFDEILSNNDVNFRRLGCINIVGYDMQPGEYKVESFEPYTMRYLKLVVFNGACTVKNIHLREYADSDIARASFHSSNEKLNKIYAAGVETCRQNAVDIFMDCPSRERAGWLCDSYFTSRVANDLSGNTLIEKNFLENFLLPKKFKFIPDGMLPMCYPADHDNGVFIPNWAMWFVVQLPEYLHRSNDRDLVNALEPRVLRLFKYLKGFENDDGLLEKLDSWVFVEWSEANKFVQDVNYPTNMLYSATLAAAGRLYNRADLLQKAENIRKVIRKQSFNGHFFVDNAMRQKDGTLHVTDNTTEVCQYYAFYFDIASPEKYPELWRALVEDFGPQRKQSGAYPKVFPANAFIGNYLRLELLSRYGKTAQLMDESVDYFLYMAERTGTLWENISPNASCDHGFASHVVHVLYRDVLGIYDIDIARKKIILRFSDVDLQQCEGQRPVGEEILSLKWWKNDGTLYYHLQAPKEFETEVKNLSGLRLKRAQVN